MDRLKKFWKDHEDECKDIALCGMISVTAFAAMCALHMNGKRVTSCDLFTDDNDKLVIMTYHKNGTTETWHNPNL